MAGFRAQLLRFTVFTAAEPAAMATLWQEFAGSEPDVEENRVKEGFRRQAGNWRQALLEIQWRAGRLDFIATPRVEQQPAFDIGFAKVEFDEFSKKLVSVVEERLSGVVRIAIGGAFLMKAKDLEDAVSEFANHTRIPLERVKGSRDLMLRENRRTITEFGECNRMYTWSVAVFQSYLGGAVPTLLASEQHFLRLELDHNTLAEQHTPMNKPAGWTKALIQLARSDIEGGAQ